jgi:hypothetical protein
MQAELRGIQTTDFEFSGDPRIAWNTARLSPWLEDRALLRQAVS